LCLLFGVRLDIDIMTEEAELASKSIKDLLSKRAMTSEEEVDMTTFN
ncbi:68_t:CDS:1, partial [Cetraspora pellucida]